MERYLNKDGVFLKGNYKLEHISDVAMEDIGYLNALLSHSEKGDIDLEFDEAEMIKEAVEELEE